MRIFNYYFGGNASDGSFVVISKHPKSSLTWHWHVSIGPIYQPFGVDKWFGWCRSVTRNGQWHDYYFLLKRWQITFGFQDYHKDKK
jgi:hypothetical protein